MLRTRSCSSAIARRTRSWFSASWAVAATSATIAGCAVCSGPVTSIAPTIAPLSGSCTGAAAQVHAWTARTRCSAEWIDTGASTASAVPIAFVPMASSDQVVPGASPTASALDRRLAAPSRHRTVPSASVTTMMCTASSAMLTSVLRSIGSTALSGWAARTTSRSPAPYVTGASWRSGSTRAAKLRRHDSDTTDRGAVRPDPTGQHGVVHLVQHPRPRDGVRRSTTASRAGIAGARHRSTSVINTPSIIACADQPSPSSPSRPPERQDDINASDLPCNVEAT